MFSRKNKGGYQFNIAYAPNSSVSTLAEPTLVALSPKGIAGLKPRVITKLGEQVKMGQELAHHKPDEKIRLLSPAGGTIKEIRYGARRVLQAIVIEVASGEEPEVNFGALDEAALAELSVNDCREKLLDLGLWTRFGNFPNKKRVPLASDANIEAIHVASFYSEPHMPESRLVFEGNLKEAVFALKFLGKLAPVYLHSVAETSQLLSCEAVDLAGNDVVSSRYPEANAGVQAWRMGKQPSMGSVLGVDPSLLVDIGYALLHGRLKKKKVYAIAGNSVRTPTHCIARIGISVEDLVKTETLKDPTTQSVRYIGGGLLQGDLLSRNDYLAPSRNAVQVMAEDRERIPFAFFRPGFGKLSAMRTWAGGFNQSAKKNATTSNNGEERACIQCGECIKICPVNLFPNLIMKASLAGDIERMEALSIADCVDCGLCTFVCPSKIEMGRDIENGKLLIAKEG